MKNQQITGGAEQLAQSLRKQTKAQVFSMWCSTCLGRIHCAKLSDQRKDWMIYDIVRGKYGTAVANQLA